jgi:hypothetical protein
MLAPVGAVLIVLTTFVSKLVDHRRTRPPRRVSDHVVYLGRDYLWLPPHRSVF